MRGEQHDARMLHGMPAVARRFLIPEIDRERAPDDRLDTTPGELVGELERPEHVVGVGEREGRLAIRFRKLREPSDRQRAFKQRIGRVHMQVHKAGVGHRFLVILKPASKLGRRDRPSAMTFGGPPRLPQCPACRPQERSRQPHRNVAPTAGPEGAFAPAA
jgi:hypothetical protein